MCLPDTAKRTTANFIDKLKMPDGSVASIIERPNILLIYIN